MTNIRIIKPALFRCEKLFEAEQYTKLPLRLAFIGLFTCCDHDGRFCWQAPSLKLDVLPYDSIDFAAVLDALATYGFIVKFMRHDQYYGFIPNWHKYQSITLDTSNKLTMPKCYEHISKQHTANTALMLANTSHNDQDQRSFSPKTKESTSDEHADRE